MSNNSTNQDSVLGDYVLQWQKKIEERDRLRREREKEIERQRKEEAKRKMEEEARLRRAKEERQRAEQERIRAEQEAILRAQNIKKAKRAALILFCVVLVIVAFVMIFKHISAKHAIREAYELIENGDQLVTTYHFDEAHDLFDTARKKTDDSDVQQQLSKSTKKLAEARQIADVEYNKALKRLKILLDADDNEFNQYSNECLDKMIEIYPERKETKYYKNMRGK